MAVTPRRSTRGTVFSPATPQTSTPLSAPGTTITWTSAPLNIDNTASEEAGPSRLPSSFPNHDELSSSSQANGVERSEGPNGEGKTYYSSFLRQVAATGRKKKDELTRFKIGDGVTVSVEGGDGIGILTRLWEEPEPDDSDDEDEESEDELALIDPSAKRRDDARGTEKNGDGDSDSDGSQSGKMRKMGEVHWCFRRRDLPGIMKDVKVQENEVLLAASPSRPVTTTLPLALLLKPTPIYSYEEYNRRYAPEDSVVKGWTYIRQGIYWCSKAFDKGARGGQVWDIDIDDWKERGKTAHDWTIKVKKPKNPEPEPESETESEASGSEVEPGDEEASSDEDDNMDVDGDGEVVKTPKRTAGRKRKSVAGKGTEAKKRARESESRARVRAQVRSKVKSEPKRRLPHPKSSTSRLPASIPDAAQLPVDPYERALRLLHVGATPESLPCREEEFVDVLSKVEEGVETGGGGCLYIAGVPGTGKTATVHAVVKELKRKAEDGELPPFSYVEINGLKVPSPQHAYSVLWEAISGARGTSPKTALRGLDSHFGRKTSSGVRGPRGHTFIVLMDELDQLLTTKQDVVYNFFNWPTMRDSQLFVIAVANRMDLPQHLAAKIKSRLGLQTLLFQPYDRTSLIEIVQSRLIPHPKSTADHKVLSPDAIALAATKMAGTNGDARRVLDACRRAVEVAIEKHSLAKTTPAAVTPKDMMAVLNQMSSSPVAMFIKQCSIQQRLMMAAVVRCVRREGLPEIQWRSIRTDHDALTRSLLDSQDLLSSSELALVFSSLIATHALTAAFDNFKNVDERRIALGMEIGEVGRVLMNEGESWRRALAGV